jgi:hypothetical protein
MKLTLTTGFMILFVGLNVSAKDFTANCDEMWATATALTAGITATNDQAMKFPKALVERFGVPADTKAYNNAIGELSNAIDALGAKINQQCK